MSAFLGKEKAAALGTEIDIVARVDDKADAIEEGRCFLNACWIDAQYCARGIQCLDNYRKEWDEVRGVWRSKPVHDWSRFAHDRRYGLFAGAGKAIRCGPASSSFVTAAVGLGCLSRLKGVVVAPSAEF